MLVLWMVSSWCFTNVSHKKIEWKWLEIEITIGNFLAIFYPEASSKFASGAGQFQRAFAVSFKECNIKTPGV